MHAFEIVDLDRWRDGTQKAYVTEQVRGACEQLGFFLITNHHFNEQLIHRMCGKCRKFFDLPVTTKSLYPAQGPKPGGFEYLAFEQENLAATLGSLTLPDRKEVMDFGFEFGGVEWPRRPAGLESIWHDYFREMETLCRTLRAILASAAGLDEQFFEAKFEQHLSSIRAVNYPVLESPPLPDQLRAGVHTDYGFLTVLLSEDRTPHRVANPPEQSSDDTRRQSIAFFHNPARKAVIETLPTFLSDASTPRYEPITYGEYAMVRQAQASGNQSLVGEA